jgi:hypothetical protein
VREGFVLLQAFYGTPCTCFAAVGILMKLATGKGK